MFENLGGKLEQALKNIKGQGQITEINVANTVKDIRRALLDADVNFKVAKEVTEEIREEAMGQNVLISVKPGELFTKIVSDKLTEIMGGQVADFDLEGKPAIILVAGLQGSGKTTFCGKLARMLKSQGKQVMLAACDIYRPAAIDQLQTLGQQVGVPVHAEPENKNAVAIAQHAIDAAKANNRSVLIVDTAGRLAVDEAMMTEIAQIKAAVVPSQTLFVVDSMTGQDAVNTAKAFNDRLDYDGVVLTKLDGDTRGGAALSIRRVVEKPIKFIGTGEKLDKLDVFYPDRMAQRILGMGDVVSLVERAQQAYDEEEARKLQKKIRKNELDFNDFLSQISHVEKMGSLNDLIGMLPGMSKMLKGVEVDDNAFKPIKAMIYSMTPKERAEPELLDASRRQRIAKGSGTSVQQVNQLIKQFDEMRKAMKQMSQMNGGGGGAPVKTFNKAKKKGKKKGKSSIRKLFRNR